MRRGPHKPETKERIRRGVLRTVKLRLPRRTKKEIEADPTDSRRWDPTREPTKVAATRVQTYRVAKDGEVRPSKKRKVVRRRYRDLRHLAPAPPEAERPALEPKPRRPSGFPLLCCQVTVATAAELLAHSCPLTAVRPPRPRGPLFV